MYFIRRKTLNNPTSPRPEPIVRPATGKDVESVAQCVQAAFVQYIERMDRPPSPMLADFPAIIAAGQVWVAEANSQIVGVLVQYETEDGFYIDTVAVIPALKGTGVGRALLKFAELEAQRHGYQSIYLCTNVKMTENRAFYPRIGYVEYEQKKDQGYDRVFFRKQLRN
jgi:N-acetylglutamate synthase-like GNAT family acetyltransferase